ARCLRGHWKRTGSSNLRAAPLEGGQGPFSILGVYMSADGAAPASRGLTEMNTDVSSWPGRPNGMKQWSVNSELTFGPTFCARDHWPFGSFWVTQMSAPPRPPVRRLMKYSVLPAGVIRGS